MHPCVEPCLTLFITMNKYFRDALEDYSFDAAAGRAIEHLHSLGYTAEQISGMLDFPVSAERVNEHIKKLNERNDSEAGDGKKYRYVKKYGKFGRTWLKREIKEEE